MREWRGVIDTPPPGGVSDLATLGENNEVRIVDPRGTVPEWLMFL